MNRPKAFIGKLRDWFFPITIIVIFVLLGGYFGVNFIRQDRCLDNGGTWDYLLGHCVEDNGE